MTTPFWKHMFATAVVLGASVATAADVPGELSAPAEAAVGSTIDVGWSGTAANGDFISIDTPEEIARHYGSSYGYPAGNNPVSLLVPAKPGEYVIRYHLAGSYDVIATAPLRVVSVAAALEVPATVQSGTALRVTWQGPNYPGDFISIDAIGAPERTYGAYAYTSTGNPVAIATSAAPGDYVVRYHLGTSYAVVAEAATTILGTSVALTVPTQAVAGASIEVGANGPNQPGDFISIDAPDADDRTYGNHGYPERGNPVSVRVPDVPGTYEVRYHQAETYRVIGRAPLDVTPVTATVTPPQEVIARRVFDVAWEGPNNPDDTITVVPVGSQDPMYGPSNGYPKHGNPVRIEAPTAAGDYEVRYVTGGSRIVLARAPLRVTPDATPGRLRVVAAAGSAASTFGAIELILDASGSMLQRLGNRRRIDLAKASLTEIVADVLPAGTPLALRVFGHKEADSCRTDLEIPLAPLDTAAATARIASVESKNLAKTPIGASLDQVRADLAGVTGPALVVLVTDGEETCGGDPGAAIEALRSKGFDVRINIVGFAIDDLALKETFEAWARAGNGGYFDAQDGAELSRAVRQSLATSFEASDGERVVGTGTVGGEPVELPPGTYRIRRHGGTGSDQTVTIEAGGDHSVEL